MPHSTPSFSLTYSHDLPEPLWQRATPTHYKAAELVYWNAELANKLGLDGKPTVEWQEILAGRASLSGVQTISQAYAGHQFGYFTNLGDGRAHLLGEWLSPTGQRHDLQLKGSGQTPFSRRGDGKASLGPMVKEVLFSEALHALGIPTTRSLAVLRTHETVYRELQEPGALLARIAQSHIRVGTFQFARAVDYNAQTQALLPALLQYSVRRHFPELQNSATQALDFFYAVAERQATLLAQWQAVGFIHGVMNTDNMLISGESIDFGPCAWLDTYSPNAVFSSIDRNGRYAYGNQPRIAQWNLARLGEALLPLIHTDEEQAQALVKTALERFAAQCLEQTQQLQLQKLGLGPALSTAQTGQALPLLEEWLQHLDGNQLDYVQSHRALSDQSVDQPLPSAAWRKVWLALNPDFTLMQNRNPLVSPRNHAVQELLDLMQQDPPRGLQELPAFLKCLQNPFKSAPQNPWYEKLRLPRPENTPPHVTFCGT